MENTSMTSLAPHFESILDTLSDGVFISDAEGTTLFVNKMYETLTGLRQGEIRGKNIRQQGIFDKVVNPQIVETGKSATHVQQLANGKRLVLTGYPVFDDKGQLCLVVTFARDITVLTQLQEEMTAQKKLIEQFHDRLAFLAREQTRELVPVFESREMKEVMSLVERFASSDATVLILGETGVGKDVVARLTHELSPRKEKMFLKVDCGGISESLTESELFGYMPGAFTGAGNKGKSGYFEMADGGTVFLDEIGELSLAMQTRLLRVLQDGEIMRVGSSKPRKVNVRIIAATNRNLAERVEKGLFRRDLYYRLNVAVVNIPPLRERPDDIQPLVTHFLNMFTSKYRKHMNLTPGLMEALRQYSWPGNVRELDALLRRYCLLSDGGQCDRALLEKLLDDLRATQGLLAPAERPADKAPTLPDGRAQGRGNLRERLETLEREIIRAELEKCAHNRGRAAKNLGISANTLWRKMKAGPR